MMNDQNQWSRRDFLTSVSGAGAALMLNPLVSWAVDPDPRVAAIVAATIGIDAHNHIDVPLIASEVPGPAIDLVGEMKRSGLSAICMTFAVDYQPLRNPGDAYERFKNGMASMNQQLSLNGVKRSLNMADIQTAHKQHQPTVIQSMEGGHFLEGRLERLEETYNQGLRQLGLLHDNDATVPLGDVYTKPPQWGGLTPFGADVIKECNRLGILVDLTHASNQTTDAALKLATYPVIISHTGDSPLAYAQHVRALVDVIGTDHVCIGTDTKLTPAYRSGGPAPQPGGNSGNQQAGTRNGTNNQNGPGGGQNRGRTGERTNEAWADQKVGFYYAVVDSLLKVGFSEDEIGRIGGGNFCRVFDAATAGHH